MSHEIVEGAREGIGIVTLRGRRLAASFAPGAGMIGCSLIHDGDELLGQREGLARYAESGSTMGIPLLAPWANRVPGERFETLGRDVHLDRCPERVHRDEHGLPIHGLLAGDPRWAVLAAEADSGAARLETSLDVDLPCFPFPHALVLAVELRDEELRIATTVTATGDTPVPLALGFHPYFTLPGVAREAFELELPVRRRVVLDERQLPTGQGEEAEPFERRLGDRTFDDCYDRLDHGRPFVLAGGARRIEVSFDAGFPVAQVYAPPRSDFVCFEPMAAPVAALATGDGLRAVEPGQSATATFVVRVTAA
jgi:aldose 1-epimerase